jgi:UDP-MurNAc hydroxylase
LQITYLGHAGFVAESDFAIVITDPWLSPTGAFDASWFQLPRNHHVAPLVYEKLRDRSRSIYLYISHEHQDHFDITFLKSLPERKFTLLIPEFSRSALMEHFSNYECEKKVFFHHKQRFNIPGGFLKFYVDDSQLNRDSAVLVKMGESTFLDMNDCKLFDALPEIVREDGAIKVFACQFSGATWHPVCYDYPQTQYESLSARKSIAKFESVAKAVQLIRPEIYIPSAGPVCFLDPDLFHINTQPINIFPRAAKVISYFKTKPDMISMFIPEMMPGDVLDADSSKVITLADQRFNDETATAYIAEYATSFSKLFQERRILQEKIDEEHVMSALHLELERKLQFLSLSERVKVPLYFRLSGKRKLMLKVDIKQKIVERVSANEDANYYEVDAPSWQVAKVLDRELTWEEFSLTFRVRLKRNPDIYDPVLHAFLVMEAEDIGKYCELLLKVERQEQRIDIQAAGKKYSVKRFCPHQGGDLSCGWMEKDRFLVCPRHRWQFDLIQDGRCTSNATSIEAVCLTQKLSNFDELESGEQAHRCKPAITS